MYCKPEWYFHFSVKVLYKEKQYFQLYDIWELRDLWKKGNLVQLFFSKMPWLQKCYVCEKKGEESSSGGKIIQRKFSKASILKWILKINGNEFWNDLPSNSVSSYFKLTSFYFIFIGHVPKAQCSQSTLQSPTSYLSCQFSLTFHSLIIITPKRIMAKGWNPLVQTLPIMQTSLSPIWSFLDSNRKRNRKLSVLNWSLYN